MTSLPTRSPTSKAILEAADAAGYECLAACVEFRGLLAQPSEEQEMLCLDDIWNACGRKRGYKPSTWVRRRGNALIECVRMSRHVALDQIIRVLPSGRVYACDNVAIAYAEAVDVAFYIATNTVIGYRAGFCSEAEFMNALTMVQQSPAGKIINAFLKH